MSDFNTLGAWANRKWCEPSGRKVSIKALMIFRELGEAKFWPAGSAQDLCSGRTDGQNLSFPASFSLVHFFWRSKRNEQESLQDKESNMLFGRAKPQRPALSAEALAKADVQRLASSVLPTVSPSPPSDWQHSHESY